MPQKLRAGILAATGTIGQRFVELLADHPYFELTALGASSNSAGRTYREACAWQLSADPPSKVAEMIVRECTPDMDCEVVFSALPSIRRVCSSRSSPPPGTRCLPTPRHTECRLTCPY